MELEAIKAIDKLVRRIKKKNKELSRKKITNEALAFYNANKNKKDIGEILRLLERRLTPRKKKKV